MNVVDEETAEVFTLNEFRQLVEGVDGQGEHEGAKLDKTKGFAFPARIEPQVTDAEETVYTEDPSIQITDLDSIPEWATHIAWYTK